MLRNFNQYSVVQWLGGLNNSSALVLYYLLMLSLTLGATEVEPEHKAIFKKAKTSYREGKFDSATFLFEKAIQLSQKEHDTVGWIIALNDYSIMVDHLGDDQKRFTLLDSALLLADICKAIDPTMKATLLSNRASIYAEVGNVEKTIKTYQDILEMIPVDTVTSLRAAVCLNLSKQFGNRIHLDSANLDSALVYANKAVQFAQESSDSLFTARAIVYQATLEGINKNYEFAKIRFKESITLYTALGNKAGVFFATIQSALSDYVNGEYALAISVVEDELVINEQSANLRDRSQAYDVLYRSYIRLDRYEESLRAHEDFFALYKEINHEEAKRELARLETKYQLRQKDLQLKLLNEQAVSSQQQKQLLLLLLLLILILAIVGIAYIRNRTKTKLVLAREKETALSFELEAKSRELFTKGLHIAEKNEFIRDLLADIDKAEDKQTKSLILLKQKLKQNLKADNPWVDFKKSFEEIHQDFYLKLRTDYSSLTERELRLLAFAKIGMNNREVATLLHIEVNSIKTARYRLKKKLDLAEDQSLESFVAQM